MLGKVRELFGGQYDNLCRVEIVRKNLEDNYRYLSSRGQKLQIAPVLKSNAYGHGLWEVARILDPLRPPFLCVDSLFEAYELLKVRVKTPVLVMGYVGRENLARKKLPFSFCAYDLEALLTIHGLQPQAGIHLFVDTGMHREGEVVSRLPSVIRAVKKYKINLEGLMSHLGEAFAPDSFRTKEQVANFRWAREILANMGIFPKWVHIASSGVVLNAKKYGELGNMARVGKALYTVVKPTLRMVAKIAQIKEIKKGDKVGYSFTFTARKPMKLAVLPIGYNDGVDRRLSNRGVVKIKGKFCPIVGRVSMNITTVDVSFMKNVKAGDEVEVISIQPSDPNSVVNIAKICGTIPYEILVHVTPTTKRVVV